jgi:hypothetical protein
MKQSDTNWTDFQNILKIKNWNPSGHQCIKYMKAKIPILPLLIP